MAANLPPVPPRIGENFDGGVLERWLKALRNRVSESLVGFAVQTANGFAGSIANPTATSTQLTLSVSVSGMLKGQSGALTSAVKGTDYLPPMSWQQQLFTGTQSAAANTVTLVPFDTIGTSVTVPVSGVYNIQFSVQAANSSAADDNITLWVRVNGADLPNSAGIVSVPAKHGSIDGAALFSWNLFRTMAAGDTLSLAWTTDNGSSRLLTYPAGTSPAHPASPAVIFTLNQIAV
jgi:hypothetical protein